MADHYYPKKKHSDDDTVHVVTTTTTISRTEFDQAFTGILLFPTTRRECKKKWLDDDNIIIIVVEHCLIRQWDSAKAYFADGTTKVYMNGGHRCLLA
jgi:hypothetical protein